MAQGRYGNVKEISFEDHGKKGKTDSRSWRYEEIQQLTVSPSELRILTYEDSKWKLEYVFDRLPKDLAVETYPLWADKLDQRFIAAVPAPDPSPKWKAREARPRRVGNIGNIDDR